MLDRLIISRRVMYLIDIYINIYIYIYVYIYIYIEMCHVFSTFVCVIVF